MLCDRIVDKIRAWSIVILIVSIGIHYGMLQISKISPFNNYSSKDCPAYSENIYKNNKKRFFF